MKIVADRHIPFLEEAVRNGWPDVQILPLEPEQIDASSVHDADVLVVRTRTRVDASLLADSNVRLVCSATIGYDHIDTAWCEAHGIRWTACPGCNAKAVCDYIAEVLDECLFDSPFERKDLSDKTIGIIGVGHVGSLVASMAHARGLRLLLNDPAKGFTDGLETIARESDIITFHVPLDETTFHMCDEAFLSQCQPHALIINASRGGVVDEQALLRSGHPYVIDTWEGEPNLNHSVLAHARLASMHIAGYSLEGKLRATQMCLDAISETFDLPPVAHYSLPIASGDSAPDWLTRISARLKAHPDHFESLRKSYPLR